MRRFSHARGAGLGYLLGFLIIAGMLGQFQSSARASNLMWQEYTYSSTMGSRPYFVYTPANYQLGTAAPLIVMLHGCAQTATDFAASTQMNSLADQYNFIVVYPQQTSAYNQYLCWNWYDAANQARGSGEPAIIAGIVQSIEQNTPQWTIDPRRIYVTGISAGAAMSVILGATYPDIFAAIGVHSGLEYQATTTPTGVVRVSRRGGPDPVQQGQLAYDAMGSFARVVPTIVFHGASDYVVNPTNGDQVVQQWMQTNTLASNGFYTADFNRPASATSGQVLNGRSYITYKWNDNNGSEIQEYWTIKGMGHAWSGGSSIGSFSDPKGPNASLAMYTFFMNHPMNQGTSFWRNLQRTLTDWLKVKQILLD